MGGEQRTITYEVHVRRGSRWQIHARFDGNNRNQALTRAKALNRHPGVTAVRMVKEIYDPAEGSAQEFVVYNSRVTRRRVRPPDPTLPRRPLLRRSLDQILAAPPALGNVAAELVKAIACSPHWRILPQALLGTFAAFFAAVLVTGIVAYAFDGGGPIAGPGSGLGVLIAVFAGIFLVCALAAGFLLTADAGRGFSAFSRLQAWPARPRRAKVTGLRGRSPRRPLPPGRSAASPARAGTPAAAPRREDEICGRLVAYLRQAIQPARGAYDLADTYIRFGVNLFVAGACESLCQERDIAPPSAAGILAAGLEAAGLEAGRAASLSANYVEYLVSDARYMAMFDRGRQAMRAQAAGKADAADLLWRALDAWTQPQPSPDTPQLVTVMFTRIVGFDDLAGTASDEASRRVLRAHNQIVERRLADFRGKRIKQVDGGTMAAFTTAADALRAADAMRSDFARQPRLASGETLAVGIGLNCGEPIAEGNDLFGTSVQLAARIVGVAKPGQVLVSETLRDQLAGEAPTMRFVSRGPHPLKGFDKPVPLFELVAV